ncbi:uncharacterized protein LOC126203945 [Schistocerca nitens]|uniref:uncharacterized protein LOC126203945 n=1 Tax=Schistocerca nitens TaxID=7011 RepID=UPI002117579C|nr:uncharacterized protein LOC126203945 [Schistocerca nitens]
MPPETLEIGSSQQERSTRSHCRYKAQHCSLSFSHSGSMKRYLRSSSVVQLQQHQYRKKPQKMDAAACSLFGYATVTCTSLSGPAVVAPSGVSGLPAGAAAAALWDPVAHLVSLLEQDNELLISAEDTQPVPDT